MYLLSSCLSLSLSLCICARPPICHNHIHNHNHIIIDIIISSSIIIIIIIVTIITIIVSRSSSIIILLDNMKDEKRTKINISTHVLSFTRRGKPEAAPGLAREITDKEKRNQTINDKNKENTHR